MYNSSIIALESYVPKRVVTNDELSNLVETSDEWITSRTGISERRITTEENTSDLSISVAKKLIETANINPEEIELIIIATISPDYLTPATACIVQGAIGAKNAVAFDISAACSGFVYSLSVADKFIKSGLYKNAIVIGAETLSKITNWEDRGTCVLFGDGAGGVFIKADETKNSIIAEDLHSDGSNYQSLTAGKLGINNPFTTTQADNKEDFYFQMNGRDIFNFATKMVPKSINNVLQKAKVSMDDIKYIVPHQANSRIVEIIAKKLGLSMDRFYLNLNKFGNTSAGSIPIALAEMVNKNVLNKGDKIIITGFGGGLTWGSMLIQI